MSYNGTGVTSLGRDVAARSSAEIDHTGPSAKPVYHQPSLSQRTSSSAKIDHTGPSGKLVYHQPPMSQRTSSSAEVDHTGPSAKPVYHQPPVSQRTLEDDNGVVDRLSPSHQAMDVDHTRLQHKTDESELFEISRSTLPQKQVFHFHASSSLQHSVTPLPLSTASPAAGLAANEKQLEFPSTANPRRPISRHLQHHIPRSIGDSASERAEIVYKSFLHMVNLLVSYELRLRSSASPYCIHNCIYTCLCVQSSVFVLNVLCLY